MSKLKTYRLRSKFDGLRLVMRQWHKEECKAVVLLVHGIGEHSNVYKPWVKRFTQHNLSVIGFDLRGHGLSAGKRGHTPIYRAYMSDLAFIYRKAKELYPNLPIVLYGHSMGGNLALNFSLKKRLRIVGTIASSPWITLAFEPPFYKVFLGKLLGLFWPDYSDSNKPSIEAENDIDKEEDPLLHDRISIRTYSECKKIGNRILKNPEKIELPVLIMHGTHDKRTSWLSSAKVGAKLPHSASKFVSFERAEHELHEWENNDAVFETIITWIDQLLTKK